ncbi:hypothetical protein BV25DRAFT_1787271, partial [Artomyces pyxidatus]
IKQTISIGEDTSKCTYKLKGIVYHGGYHFTARIIGDKGNTWYHDGIATGRLCTPEDKFSNIADIYKVANRQATVLIYSAL